MRSWRWICPGAALVGWVLLASCSAGGGGTGIGDQSDGAGGTGASSGAAGTANGGSGAGVIVGGAAGVTGGMCEPETGPFCGDGTVNVAGEVCDDGNALPGDGCTGVCTKEPNFDCPAMGGTCTSTVRCGDGMRSPGENCDDGNNASNDGCAADCSNVEPGYFCPTPGQPCMRTTGECGDSRVQPGETCDDGGAMDGDGCSALCRVEDGWRCTQPGMPCIQVPICGNGAID